MTRRPLISALLALAAGVPLLLALFAVPVTAQTLSVTVTAPGAGAIVNATVTFNGTTHDPAGRLKTVQIVIDGVPTPLTVNIPGNQADAAWETTWDSTAVPDGRTNATVTVINKDGETSPSVNRTFIVDNDREPRLEALQVLFDAQANGTYAPWNDTTAMPTTRLSFELEFSEEMDEASLQEGLAFVGGNAAWELARNGTASYWVNVSYLDANTSYNFTAGSSATDLAANPVLENGYEFSTVAEPTAGTPEPPTEPSDPDDPDDPTDPGGPGEGLSLSFLTEGVWPWIAGIAAAAAVVLVVAQRKGLLPRRGEPEVEYEWVPEEDDGSGE